MLSEATCEATLAFTALFRTLDVFNTFSALGLSFVVLVHAMLLAPFTFEAILLSVHPLPALSAYEPAINVLLHPNSSLV